MTRLDKDKFISSMSGCLGYAALRKGEQLENIAKGNEKSSNDDG